MNIRSGFKYQAASQEIFDIPKWWPHAYRYVFENDWIRLTEDNLTIRVGYAWNGANGYPDYDWIKIPSAVHDGMLQARHYLLEQGDIDPEDDPEFKRLIDRWFTELSQQRMPKWRRGWTKVELFVGVNWLSRIAPGPDQEEAHAAIWYD